MKLKQARAALSTHFATNWGTITPIIWDRTLPATPVTAFVRFSVQHTDSKLQSWGNQQDQDWRHYGIASVQIFVRPGSGSAQSDDLSQYVRDILMGKRLGELTTYEASVHEDGPDGLGWDQTRVLVRFQYTETTT